MDVDVQRYYLIQVPLRRDATGVRLSNMGTPPWASAFESPLPVGVTGGVPGGVVGGVVGGLPDEAALQAQPALEATSRSAQITDEPKPGLARVAIGHGETEGPYDAGGGYRGARAEEPIRVTVVYFVTPVGEVTREDMESFAAAFARWDTQAIWGGSFVTKETF